MMAVLFHILFPSEEFYYVVAEGADMFLLQHKNAYK